MLVLITAEDSRPIPLVLGFSLLGVGGLRRRAPDGGRAGGAAGLARRHARQSCSRPTLSPTLPAVIRALTAVFPPRSRQPPARASWPGRPALVPPITLDLAVILRVRGSVRRLRRARPHQLSTCPRRRRTSSGSGSTRSAWSTSTRAVSRSTPPGRLPARPAGSPSRGAMALRALGAGSGFVLAIGGFNPHFTPPPGVPALERVAIALSVGRQPQPALRGVLRADVELRPVRRARAAARERVRVQHRRRGRVRRTGAAQPVRVDRRLPRLCAAQARHHQPLHGQGRRRVAGSPPAAGERQGQLRDLLVRLHHPVRPHAHRRGAAAAAAGPRPARRTAAQPRRPTQLDQPAPIQPGARRQPPPPGERPGGARRSARRPGGEPAGAPAEHLASGRGLRRRAALRSRAAST